MSQSLARPPQGSCVVVELTPEGLYRIHWRTAPPGCARFGSAAFLLFWLCGWAVGEGFVITALVNHFFGLGLVGFMAMDGFVVSFVCVWLFLWTIGGATAMVRVYLLLRPPRPESITLGLNELVHDPGTGPLDSPSPRMRRQPLPPTAPAKQRTFTAEQLATLRLERIGDHQRLTIDSGPERVEVGPTLAEPEREWLHDVLAAWAGR